MVVALGVTCGSALAKPFAYVPNQGSNNVSVIDVADNTVVTNVRAGISPVRVAIHPNNQKVYVANIGSDRVTVINTVDNTVGRTIVVGDSPAEILVSPDGSQVYTPNAQGSNVTVIATATETVITNLPTAYNSRAILWVTNSIGNRVYVANQGNSTLTVINPATLAVVATIPVGGGPRRMAVTPDGSRVYVSNYLTDDVSVINALSLTRIKTIPVAGGPRGVSVTPDGSEVWVTNLQTNTITIISTATDTVTTNLPSGVLPWTVVFNRAGTRAYTLNSGNNNCSIHDVATRALIKTVPVGAGCFWAELNSDDSRLFVTNPPDGTVSVIDTINNVPIATIFTGESAWVIALQTDDPPSIASVFPNQINAGTTVQITVTGANFRRDAVPALDPAVTGVTISNVNVAATSNQMTFTMSTLFNSPTGSANLRVTNIDGTTTLAVGALTILPAIPQPPPGVTGMNPAQVTAGTTTPVTIQGTNFQAGAVVSVVGNPLGLAISSALVQNANSITCDLTAAVNAAAGPHGITVMNPDGQSDTENALFTVTPAAPPTLQSASPSVISAGSAVDLTAFGTGLHDGLVAEVEPATAAIAVTGTEVLSATSLVVSLELALDAPTGPRGLKVTNLDGQFASSSSLFTVQSAPAPTISGVSPTTVVAGTTRAMTLFGTGFFAGVTVSPAPSDPGLSISNVQRVDETTLTFDLAMAQSVSGGQYGFTVRNIDNQAATANNILTINPYVPPIVNSATPTQIVQGETWLMTVSGAQFQTGATAALTPANSRVTLSNTQVLNADTMTTSIAVATNATTGSFGLVVTNPDGLTGTGNNLFSIVPLPALAVTGVAPSTVNRGTTANLTIFGRGFVPASGVSFGGPGQKITVVSKTYINSTNLNVTVSVGNNVKTGAKSVTVSRPGSSSVTLQNAVTVQ